MTEINKKFGWRWVKNKVSERMVDSSLIHQLVPNGKMRRRTKMLNRMIKDKFLINNYRQYVEMRLHVLDTISDDNDTDIELELGEEDYKRIYSNETLEYNKSISMHDVDSLSPEKHQPEGEHEPLNCEDYSHIHEHEATKLNNCVFIPETLTRDPLEVQLQQTPQKRMSTEKNVRGVKKNAVRKPRLKKVVKKPKVGKIGVKKLKKQKVPNKVQTEMVDLKSLGWQTIVKRKHMPRCTIPPENRSEAHTNEISKVTNATLPSHGQQETQPSTSSETFVSDKENVNSNTNDLKDDTVKPVFQSRIASLRNKSKTANVKKNLIMMWESLTMQNQSTTQPLVDNSMDMQTNNNNIQHPEPVPASEPKISNAGTNELPLPLSNNEELIHHPKDSGIDDDSQEESGDGGLSVPSAKQLAILPIREELVNGNISALEEEENNEELQDPLKLDNSEENRNAGNYDHETKLSQASSDVGSTDHLGSIEDTSVTSNLITHRLRKPSESDDTSKPKVMCTEILSRKYKIISTESLKETNLKTQSIRALAINNCSRSATTNSTCTSPTMSRRSESSENLLNHQSNERHQSCKSCLGSRSSKSSMSSSRSSRRRLKSSKHLVSPNGSKHSTSSESSTDSKSSRKSENSTRLNSSKLSRHSNKFEDSDNLSDTCNFETRDKHSDNESIESSESSQSSKISKSSEHLKRSNPISNRHDSAGSGHENSNKSKNLQNSKNINDSNILKNPKNPKNLETPKHDKKPKSLKCPVIPESPESSNSFHSPASSDSNKCSRSSDRYNSHKYNKRCNSDGNSDSVESLNSIDCQQSVKNKNSAHVQSPNTSKNLQSLETPKQLKKLKERKRSRESLNSKDPISAASPSLCIESKEYEIDIKDEIIELESFTWIEDDKDEDDETDTMTPSTARRLQQLRRLNLITGSDTSSSEDEGEQVRLRYSVESDDSDLEMKSGNESEKPNKSRVENSSDDDDNVNELRVPQSDSTVSQRRCKELHSTDLIDVTIGSSSRPCASSTVERPKKEKKHKRRLRDLAEDEVISDFSPISHIHSDVPHKELKKQSQHKKRLRDIVEDEETSHFSPIPHIQSDDAHKELKRQSQHKKHLRDLVEDEAISCFSPIPHTHSDNPHKELKKQSQHKKRLRDIVEDEETSHFSSIPHIQSDDTHKELKRQSQHKKHLRDLVEDEAISCFSPIPHTHSDNPHKELKKQSQHKKRLRDLVEDEAVSHYSPVSRIHSDDPHKALKKQSQRKKRNRDSVEDDGMSRVSPIPHIHSNDPHEASKSPSPILYDDQESFLPRLPNKDHRYPNKSYLPLKKRLTSLAASTASPSETDSLKYVLDILKKKNIEDGEVIDCTDDPDTSAEMTIQEIPKEAKIPSCKRPENLKELIDCGKLEEIVSNSVFRLKDLSEDDEIFVLNIPIAVDLTNLQGKQMVMKKRTLKIGTDKYEATCKETEPISCVFRTGKKRRRYKAVNIKPMGSIIVRRKIPNTLSLNTAELENVASSNEKDNTSALSTKNKEKKKVIRKRGRQNSHTEEIHMKKNVKRYKYSNNDETE